MIVLKNGGSIKRFSFSAFADNPQRLNGISALNFVDGFKPVSLIPEHIVAAVQHQEGGEGEVKLTAIGARAGIGHGQSSCHIMREIRVNFLAELVAGPAEAIGERVTSLDYIPWLHPVESETIEIRLARPFDLVGNTALCKPYKIGHGERGLVLCQSHHNFAVAGGQNSVEAIAEGSHGVTC